VLESVWVVCGAVLRYPSAFVRTRAVKCKTGPWAGGHEARLTTSIFGSRIVILGAGPAGLGCAYRLNEIGYHDWSIHEARDSVGGLARSETDEYGFTYDLGGHVLSSHYPYFDQFVDTLLGDDQVRIEREAWIYLREHWIPYPFQNNLRHLPPDLLVACLLGLLQTRLNTAAVPQNFEELIRARFGNGISDHFMIPYNTKVWAYPPAALSTTWLRERVPLPTLEEILRGIIERVDEVRFGPHYFFKFPLYGGTGGLFSRCEPLVKQHLALNSRAIRIDSKRKRVDFDDGSSTCYDLLFTTMPLNVLVEIMEDVPMNVRQAAETLLFSSGFSVGVGIDRPTDTNKCWIYYPENEVPFYRVTYLSHYSPHIAPPGKTLLLCESSESPLRRFAHDTVIEDAVRGLIAVGLVRHDDRIITTKAIYEKHWYPVPAVGRNDALAVIQPYLMEQGIFSRGRFGSWLYEVGNMDHAVMMGVEFVNHVIDGTPEVTWSPSR
jgi:protoporphyrinogen oxidase